MSEQSFYHSGIKGMHWYVRRFQNLDGSLTEEGKERYSSYKSDARYINRDGTKNIKKLKKDVAKDAKEYARAKAFYGEGAGTRRKKIKNKISEKMKDPDYKKEFEKQLAKQNMEEHQKAANRERKAKDVKNKVVETGNGIKNLIFGFGTTSLAAIAIYKIASTPGAKRIISEKGKKIFSSIKNTAQNAKDMHDMKKSTRAFMDYLNNKG